MRERLPTSMRFASPAALVVGLILTLAGPGISVFARPLDFEEISSWSEPVMMPQSPASSRGPAIVADQTGLVHLFWAEDEGNSADATMGGTTGKAIAYSYWDGSKWSSPIDVLVSPQGNSVSEIDVTVDQYGTLHVIWLSDMYRLYHARAQVEQAATALGWSTPVELAWDLPTRQSPAAIAADSQGNIHLIYTTAHHDLEVMHMASTDGGDTWSAPTAVSAGMSRSTGLPRVSGGTSLTLDEADGLHVGWSMYNQEGDGESVHYSQSYDGGLTWKTPLVVGEKAEEDYEADWLTIVTVGTNQIFLVWTGVGVPPGRTYRLSTDGGSTWTEQTTFMEDLVGETGFSGLLVDSASTVHLLTPARRNTGDRTSGVRYLYWTGSYWSEPALIPGPPRAPLTYGGLDLDATVRLGNQFIVAWHDYEMDKILIAMGENSAPAIAASAFLARQPVISTGTEPSAVVVEQSTASAVPTASPMPSLDTPPAMEPESGIAATAWPAWMGIIPAGLLVGIVVAIQLLRRRR